MPAAGLLDAFLFWQQKSPGASSLAFALQSSRHSGQSLPESPACSPAAQTIGFLLERDSGQRWQSRTRACSERNGPAPPMSQRLKPDLHQVMRGVSPNGLWGPQCSNSRASALEKCAQR